MSSVKRIFVEKKPGFAISAQQLFQDLKEYLGIKDLEATRILIRYDVEGISDDDYQQARTTIFAEPPVDYIYDETLITKPNETLFAIEYLPGQYDQRADSAAQCIQMLTHGKTPKVRTAKIVILQGNLTAEQIIQIKKYLINPVDSHEASLQKPQSLQENFQIPADVQILNNFINLNEDECQKLLNKLGLAMSMADLLHTQKYFRDQEQRNPTITEIKMLDTYWSDHCRHTTFMSKIEDVKFADGKLTAPIKTAFQNYQQTRQFLYADNPKNMCLMDMAVIAMKELRKKGQLKNLEISQEINACSIIVQAKIDGKTEPWLVMFKNETHNHPTEIEPFGGAATCLGGAIRDPLSGRSYVYQAMRVTGAGDPRTPLSETLLGKLPQRKITTEAAHGYSSYGNQIGLATGIVNEIYDSGYLAKRMEIGAVIAATPQKNVLRGEAKSGDVIILIGGRTGRDGCGGATGSSKEHTEESIENSGAEVQKGNPPTERKIQRLFRNPKFSKKIKVCNDFGAGGVSVAIGELADGLTINLDAVPKKYEGLDGTELAISESQERMAVLIDPIHMPQIIKLAEEENLEAVKVADVTTEKRVVIYWRNKKIVDLSREFINTNGVLQSTNIMVTAPQEDKKIFGEVTPEVAKTKDLKDAWLTNLQDLNVCSQKGLIERFDSTIGAGSVLLPFGGKYQMTPSETMVAKLPILTGETTTGTIMSHGYNPKIANWSPFHSAIYAVIQSIAKIVATGGDYQKIYLTLQEYFEKLGTDPKRWGKPFAALLGALTVQKEFAIAAIGGKDSMSGTFENLNVPPTLVSFAVAPVDVTQIISPEFKQAGNCVVYLPIERDQAQMPNFDKLKTTYQIVQQLIKNGKIISAHTVGNGGVAATISKMSLGNQIGINISAELSTEQLFGTDAGSLICEINTTACNCQNGTKNPFAPIKHIHLGKTIAQPQIQIQAKTIKLAEIEKNWTAPLEKVFPTKAKQPEGTPQTINYQTKNIVVTSTKYPKPQVFIPVFPGTNCEYDTARAFQKAGAIPQTFVLNNLTGKHINDSLAQMVKQIDNSQIIMLPGGFSAGDEPEGSGKFIAAVFRNPAIKDAVMRLLNERDGLMLGICNGFQALIKLGLLPYGNIQDITSNCPTLTFNNIGRHVSQMVQTKITSNLSPWLANLHIGDIHSVAVSHGEGRFVANEQTMQELIKNGQIATQYVDYNHNPTYQIPNNPNGSLNAIEGITSPDGRIFGKMGHSERVAENVAKNIDGNKDQKIFAAGVQYFQ